MIFDKGTLAAGTGKDGLVHRRRWAERTSSCQRQPPAPPHTQDENHLTVD